MFYSNKYSQNSLWLLVTIAIFTIGFIPRIEAGEIPPPEITTLWVPIEISTDDAEENTADGDMYLASSDLEFSQDGLSNQKVGLRFNLEIPAGATIESANIQFTTDEKTSETTVLTVYGEAIAHALTFSNTDFDISNRTLTTANTPWTPLPWLTTEEAGPDQQTPDLSAIVQEIINITGWAQGNSIAIIITGTGKRIAESFNGTAPPVLHVSFSTASTGNQAPDAVDDGTPDEPAYTTTVDQPLIVANGVDDIVERNDNPGIPSAVISTSDTSSSAGGSVLVNPDGSFTYTPASGFLGVDSFTYTLENTEGSDSATVYINVEELTGLTTLWIPVITSSDDAEQDISNGIVRLTSSDLELIRDGSTEQQVGVRFQALNIPRDSVIVEAYIQYTADENDSEETSLTIYAEASGNALSFTSTLFDISDRSLTTANIAWMPAPWNTNEQTSSIQATPDLSTIVQEIVNRNDWASGNAMAFITSGSGKRVAESFNGTAPPVLHVSFIPGFSVPGPDAVDDNFTTIMDVPLVGNLFSNDDLGFPLASVSAFDFSSIQGGSVAVSPDGSFTYTPPFAFLGPDSFTYTLSNGMASESTAMVFIEVKAAVELTSLWIPVITGSDDAEENIADGDMSLGSSDLEMIMDRSSTQLVAVRFQQVDVPAGALIEEAYIQYQVDENTSEQTDLIVHGEANVNTLTFNNADYDISTRLRTTVSIEWSPPIWNIRGLAGVEQRTPDLSAIVQEIIELEGWSAGKAMTFITSGSGNRVAESFNGTAPPELHLVYSIPQVGNHAPTATDVTITDNNGGLLIVGDSLTGNYTYNDADGDAEGGSAFRWLRNGASIPGATGTSYTTVADDARTTITFEVVPVATSGSSPGTAITSPNIFVYLQIAENEFQLGGPGPAGGTVVFISDGDGIIGTQGLEIAPEDQGKALWGCTYLLIAGADGGTISAGAQNTANIISGCPEPGIAAKIADQYTLNSFDDWFLPSKDELFLVSEPDRLPYLPDLNLDRNLYWTSTDQGDDNDEFAWTLKILSGSEEGDWSKSQLFNVRAMRAFPVATPPNSRPSANNISINDTNGDLAIVGDLLTGSYTYNDLENDLEGISTFQWLRNGVAIAGATGQSYTLVPEDLRTSLTIKVTPIATSGSSPGTTMTSSSVAVLLEIGNTDFQLGGRGPAGGIVIFISDGDGVVGTQGLEIAPEHQGSVPWGCESLSIAGADETVVGTGAQNTADVLAGCTETGTAADVADMYSLNGFDDWFLPSIDELNLLSENHFLISTFPSTFWSSSENSDMSARIIRYIYFENAWESYRASKSKQFNVLPIRSFSAANPTPEYRLGDTGPAGGIVFYISDGDGIVGTQGLEAAPEDQDIVPWGCYGSPISGADGTAAGTGAQNTAYILADCNEAGIAAELADTYSINGVDDWFLPSKDALLLLYEKRAVVGNFNSSYYWSSKENSDYSAWYQSFGSGSQRTGNKNVLYGVRAIRVFN
ncbi:MAG: Ig-like domain-containing protein [Methylococcaceae bacterium]